MNAISEVGEVFKKKKKRFRQFIGDKSRNYFPRKWGVLGLLLSSQRQAALHSFKTSHLYPPMADTAPRGRDSALTQRVITSARWGASCDVNQHHC